LSFSFSLGIPRYRLLLQDLVKNTPESHVDYKDLKECLEKITLVADQIDKASIFYKQRQQLLKLQKKFDKLQVIYQNIHTHTHTHTHTNQTHSKLDVRYEL
jgi:hypothetical protein